MQCDIFADSRDVMLRNDVLDALQRRQANDARNAWQRFSDEYPRDDTLTALAMLLDELERETNVTVHFADHRTLDAARHTLIADVSPAAARLFGESPARAWLTPCWQALAQRSASLAFRADDADNHAGPLWLRAGAWTQARLATERIELWRRIPVPLMWMTQARYHIDGIEVAWPLLTELAWLSPGRFAAVLVELADTSLDALRKTFDAQFDGAGQISGLGPDPEGESRVSDPGSAAVPPDVARARHATTVADSGSRTTRQPA
jgi:hypothetical protein